MTGETQWERPFDFVPIVREELYTTPQARFIKSILSPKRSHANMNHVMSGGVSLPNVGPPRAASNLSLLVRSGRRRAVEFVARERP